MRVVITTGMKATNRYIAVVDDEASVRSAVERLLRLRDFDPALFANGEDFLNSVDVRRPDCALVDIDMPGISGFDVARKLASARIDLPVILMTGIGYVQVPSRIEGNIAPQILRKPFTLEELFAAIAGSLRSMP